MMRKYEILEKNGDKVLLSWSWGGEKSRFFPDGVEYSVHTCINDEFYWGLYFVDKEEAIEYFNEVTGKMM